MSGIDPKAGLSGGVIRRIARFRKDVRGVAAIEFALIAPIMIGLYVMLNETASGLRAARKVTMAARVMSDLVSQATEVNNTYRDDVFAAITPIMSPFNASLASIRITSVFFPENGKGYVDWSEAQGSGLTAHTRCKPTETQSPPNPLGQVAVPDGLKLANTSVILAEVKYAYTPVMGYTITGTIQLGDQLFTRPRSGAKVARTGNPTTTCPV
ncbi:MAG: TadE/TadG family type IV pilus assembly protein [Beijerinckiaceae bacterium]